MTVLNNLPAKWDMETDVVAIGSGIGGLSAAITAAEGGLKAMVLEKSDQVGGVTALSVGEVWIAGNHHAKAKGIEDSPDSGYRYLQRLSMNYGDDSQILNYTVHARVALKYFEEKIGLKMRAIPHCPDYYYGVSNDSVSEGRMLEVLPFPASTLGEWQTKTRVSPQVPYGMTHEDMYGDNGGPSNMSKWDFTIMGERMTKDERCLGPGLSAYFVKGAIDKNVTMYTGCSAEGLIGDGKRVVGVRAKKDGKEIFIKANKGVVIAVSGYEQNKVYTKALSSQLDPKSVVFPGIDGANFRLAGPFGARVSKVPDISMVGVQVPGEEDEFGKPLWRSALLTIGMPHHMVVNREGKRFGNEAFYRSFCYKLDVIDGGNQTHPNWPCYMIFDAQAREKYLCISVMPGQELPEGMATKADTIKELAEKTGIDAANLEKTVAKFNDACAKSKDEEFGRGSHPWSAWFCGDPLNKPHPNFGPISKGPYYAVQLHQTGVTAIPATGLVTNRHAQVIGWDDQPIEGLYAAGNSVARMETGAVMQSGVSNGRGMTHGWLAGLHAAGKPSTLLEPELKRMGL